MTDTSPQIQQARIEYRYTLPPERGGPTEIVIEDVPVQRLVRPESTRDLMSPETALEVERLADQLEAWVRDHPGKQAGERVIECRANFQGGTLQVQLSVELPRTA